jgi:3-(3-hydroxy-phenyl)propionate hydroxylase
VVKTKIRQELIPGLKHGLVSRTYPCAGSVFPQPLVRGTGKAAIMLDDLTGARFRIVVNGDADRSATPLRALPHGADAALVECRDDGTISIDGVVKGTDSDRGLSRWFAQHQCTAAVIRPDGYVFGAVKTVSELVNLVTELRSYLQSTA